MCGVRAVGIGSLSGGLGDSGEGNGGNGYTGRANGDSKVVHNAGLDVVDEAVDENILGGACFTAASCHRSGILGGGQSREVLRVQVDVSLSFEFRRYLGLRWR